MKQTQLQSDCLLLRSILETHGIEIRIAHLDSDGGLVRLGDMQVLFLEKNISADRELIVYLDALRKLGTENMHLPPRVRALLGETEWE